MVVRQILDLNVEVRALVGQLPRYPAGALKAPVFFYKSLIFNQKWLAKTTNMSYF